jgi:hypothetical protein
VAGPTPTAGAGVGAAAEGEAVVAVGDVGSRDGGTHSGARSASGRFKGR